MCKKKTCPQKLSAQFVQSACVVFLIIFFHASLRSHQERIVPGKLFPERTRPPLKRFHLSLTAVPRLGIVNMRKGKCPSVLAPIWTLLYLVPQNMKVNSPCIALKSWSPLAMFDIEVGELQHFVFWGFGIVTRFVGIRVSFWYHLNRKFAGSRRVDLIERPYVAVRYDLEFIAKYVIAKANLKFEFEFEKVRVRSSTLYINAFHQFVCFLCD